MSANPLPAAETIPVITDFDAGDDRAWFDTHPGRKFRGWRRQGDFIITRKMGDTLVRTVAPADTAGADDDHQLAIAWFASAYRDWNGPQIEKAVRKTLKRGRP